MKTLHGATHIGRAVADGHWEGGLLDGGFHINKAEYARGAGQLVEVTKGDFQLKTSGPYQDSYGK